MNDPIRKVLAAFDLLSVTVAAVAANTIYKVFTAAKFDPWLVFGMSVLLVPFCKLGLSGLGRWLFGRSVRLRHILLGSKFVEGVYLEILRNKDGFVSIGTLTIECDDSGLCFHGNDYTPRAVCNYSWHSQRGLVTYANAVVEYVYVCEPHDREATYRGVAKLTFDDNNNGRCRHFAGRFIHQELAEQVGFEGWLLPEKDRELLADPEKMRELFKKWLDKAGVPDEERQIAERPTLRSTGPARRAAQAG